MKRGDVYIVQRATSDPYETSRQPVLVLSTEAFNQVAKNPIVVPIFRKNTPGTDAFLIPLDDEDMRTKGVLHCDKLTSLDLDTCDMQYLETIPDSLLMHALLRVTKIFQ